MKMPAEVTDFAKILGDARQGSRPAIERLLVLSMPKIEEWNRGWYDFLVRNRLSGRDLMQDVLLIANYSFNQFRGESADSWFSWLFTIHRRVISEFKNRKDFQTFSIPTNGTGSGSEGYADFPSKEFTPSTSVGRREEVDRVKNILELLPSGFREILLLWMDGQSLNAQAEAMGLTVSQVRTLRLNALREFSALWKTHREKG
jgi:RNA polymerase sigma factor (sigma-70 family)